MEQTRLSHYDGPVPRYTSYPTAAQFDASVGPDRHCAWLRDLNGAFAALYLHVPFCRHLCWYCACHTMAMRRESTLDAYADALHRELDLLARVAPGFIIDSILWGGGTPTQLGAARLAALGQRIAALFDRRAGAEISMEVDPRFCDAGTADAMAALGVTRASLGVQDFDAAVQEAINRPQTFEVTAATLQRLRGVGISVFNIDLVYGLPRQTIDTLSRTLDQALALAPDRFAVFGYAHVPWMKPHQKLIAAKSLPAGPFRAAMAALVSERLVNAGYVQVGIDHYAKASDKLARAMANGSLRRNFQGYVADESAWVVGVGASAISCLPGGYSQNATDAAQYMAAIAQEHFATARGVAISTDDRLRGDIIAQLMCSREVDIGKTSRRHRVEPDAFLASIEGLAPLVRDRLISIDGWRIAVTDCGRPLVRYVCAVFDRYYTGVEGKYSSGL